MILVDAGCNDMGGLPTANFDSPVSVLENMGIMPQDITDVVITHAHHDHISALGTIRDCFSAPLAALSADLNADIVPDHGQKLPFGAGDIQVLHTPGHSADSVCFYLKHASCLFSGDTLFTEDIGFCDGPQMYQSLRQVIQPLPDETVIFPGHDYGRLPSDTLGNIRRDNLFFAASGRDLDIFLAKLQDLV